MQDELEDNKEYYHSLTHEDWCELLYTIEVKYNRKRAATQIKKIALMCLFEQRIDFLQNINLH